MLIVMFHLHFNFFIFFTSGDNTKKTVTDKEWSTKDDSSQSDSNQSANSDQTASSDDSEAEKVVNCTQERYSYVQFIRLMSNEPTKVQIV